MDPVTRMLMMGAAGAAKDIEFVSSSIAIGGGPGVGQNVNTVTAPANIQDGDLLVAVGFDRTNNTVSYPAGFSQVFLNNAQENSLFVAVKVAQNESGNYSFVWSGSGVNQVAVLVYRNASDLNILAGSITRASTNTSTAASISPTAAGALIGVFGIESTVTVTTPPDGMAQRAFGTSNPALAIYDIVPNGPGATGNKTLVWSGSNPNVGLLFQIYRR
jgi:hypothetical protein